MTLRSQLLTWLFLGFACFIQAQALEISDQFPRCPPAHAEPDPWRPYVAYRKGLLWGLCDRQKQVLIEPCAKSFPSYKEDDLFRYFTETKDGEPNSFRQYTRIYDKAFNLKKALYTVNGGEMERLSNGCFLFDDRYVLDSQLNLLYTSAYTMAYRCNGYTGSMPGLLIEYHYLEKDRYSLKVYSEGLDILFDDIVQGRHVLQVYKSHRWIELKPLHSPGYALNLDTHQVIALPEGSSLSLKENAVYQPSPGDPTKSRVFTKGFKLIADSVQSMEELPGGGLLLKKHARSVVVDSLGKTRAVFSSPGVEAREGWFFLYDAGGLVNIADSTGHLLLKGQYNLLCSSGNFRMYLAAPRKFVISRHKLAIANAHDSILVRFDGFDDVSYVPDTLFTLVKTTLVKIKQANGKWVESKNYTRKLVSVSNIDYTPANCDGFNLYFNKALRQYYIMVNTNHLNGLRQLNGRELLPATFSSIWTDNDRPAFLVANTGNLVRLFDLRSGRFCDSSYMQITKGMRGDWYVTNDNRYYTGRIDSSMVMHRFDSLLVKAFSLFISPGGGPALAIGYRVATKQTVLINLDKQRSLAVIDSREDHIRSAGLLSNFAGKLYTVVTGSGDEIILDSTGAAIGRYYRDKDIHFDGTEAVMGWHGAACLLQYRNNRIVSAEWLSLLTGKKNTLFKNASYENFMNDSRGDSKRLVFYKSGRSTVMDTTGKILLGPLKGEGVESRDHSFFIVGHRDDSLALYHGQQLLLSGPQSGFAIDGSYVVVFKKIPGDSIIRIGMMDSTGRQTIPAEFTYLHSHNRNWRPDSVLYIAQAAGSKKYGIINLKGETLLPFDCDSILPYIGSSQVMGFYKSGQLYEFNPYTHITGIIDPKYADMPYRVDVGENGLYGLKDMQGRLVVRHLYSSPLRHELFWSSIIPAGIFYTIRQVRDAEGNLVNVKCYVDAEGTEYWKD